GGSGIKVVNKDKLNNVGGTVASPDGRYLYLTGRERRFSYLPKMDDGLWNLYRFDRMTSEMIRLTPAPNGGMKPRRPPDGKRIAYLRRDDAKSTLVLRDLESGTEKILTDALTRDEQEGFAQMDVYPNAAFTRDGKTLVFYSGGEIRKLDMATPKMGEIPLTPHRPPELRPLHRITKPVGEPDLTVKLLRWPTLSPDGKKLVFDALGKLWVVELTSGKAGKPRRLTKDTRREYAPEFSPDGRWIAYVTWSDQELGHVWKMRAEEGTPTRLTKVAGRDGDPPRAPPRERRGVLGGVRGRRQ